jgi:PAS domain S-box-containing protein
MNIVVNQAEEDERRLRADAEAHLVDHSEAGARIRQRTAEELLHELQVHQIELELQNEELRRAQQIIEESRDRYLNLYDFAPIGYLTLSHADVIIETNLSGAELFGLTRKALLNRRFANMISPEDAAYWASQYTNTMSHAEKQSCELALRRADGSLFQARLDCLRMERGGEFPVALIAITDISNIRIAQQLAGVVESAMDGIVSVDENHHIVLFNPAAEHMFGLPAAQALGLPLDALLPENSRASHAENIRSFARTGMRSRNLEYRSGLYGRRANGELFPIEASISQVEAQGHRLFTVILRDITERKQAEAALLQERDTIRNILQTVEAIILALDAEGSIILINRKGCDLLGWSESELIGKDWFTTCLPQNPQVEEVREIFRKAQAADMASSEYYENPVLTRSGEVRLIAWHNSTIRDAEGKVIAALSAGEDITERRRDEVALRETQADLNRAQAVGQIGSWRLNVVRNELLWSDENHRIFGIAKGTPLTYQSFLGIVHPDDREYVVRMWEAAMRGEPYDIDHRLIVNGEVKWVREKAELECDAAGRLLGGFGTTQDISELKLAEQALVEADRRKDEFLAMLAHELRNPLAPIRNAAHVLGRLPTQEPKVRWAREIIEQQVVHLTRLVDDLLDVSRIVRGKVALQLETLTLANLVDRVVEMARPLIEAKQHRFELRKPETPVWLQGDPVRLAQALLNLLDNAIKYTPEGGCIELTANSAGELIEIRVRDNGIGFPGELRPRIFDIFQQGERTLDRAQGGLGIGLTLAKHLVEMHGGRVEAASAGPGQGSEFAIWLPAMVIDSTAVREAAAKPVLASAGCRVLVVDDDPAVAESMAMLLEIEGHVVRTAANGEAALALARDFRPRLVLLDIGLGGMDGYQVAQSLRAQQGLDEKMCLVAVTGYGHEEARARARAAGFDRHLVKPVYPEAICELLAEIAGQIGGQQLGGPR